jgi:hypothetical protein
MNRSTNRSMSHPMIRRRSLALMLLAGLVNRSQADTLRWTDYVPKYPALYGDTYISSFSGKSSFDAQGNKVAGAIPTYGNDSRFSNDTFGTTLTWFFPFFEAAHLPLVSSRLWTASAHLAYQRGDTQGRIRQVQTENGIVPAALGIEDMRLEWGPVLVGSSDWREQRARPLSAILRFGINLPIGERNPDSPHNTGDNHWSLQARIGGRWQALPSVALSAEAGVRRHGQNEETAFGGQEPRRAGQDRWLGVNAVWQVRPMFYVELAGSQRRGQPNQYQQLRFTANPPAAGVGMESFPDPSAQFDNGTRQTEARVGLHYFVAPQLALGVAWEHPVSGQSGEYDQRYLQQTRGCTGTGGCNPQANGTDRVNGLGTARVLADDRWLVTATWNFRQGDFWLGNQP